MTAIDELKMIANTLKSEGIGIAENEGLESLLWKVNSVGHKDLLVKRLHGNSFEMIRGGMRLYMIFGFWPNRQ